MSPGPGTGEAYLPDRRDYHLHHGLYFPVYYPGIEDAASRNGYHLVWRDKNRVENEKRLIRTFLSDGVDGLIIEGTKSALPNPNLELYREMEKQRSRSFS